MNSIVEDLQAAVAQFAEIASDSENAVHTACSQLYSPKAHRAQDQPGSATPATDLRKDSRAAATNRHEQRERLRFYHHRFGRRRRHFGLSSRAEWQKNSSDRARTFR